MPRGQKATKPQLIVGNVSDYETYTIPQLGRAAECGETKIRDYMRRGLPYAQPDGPNGKTYISGLDWRLWVQSLAKRQEDYDAQEAAG